MPDTLLFAGPSLHGLGPEPLRPPDGWTLLPPPGRGDVEQAIEGRAAGTLVLADGLFHQVLSVGHRELRAAIESGWEVWGMSSMGAIRAYEMRHLGMKGFGAVYQHFVDHEDFRDDEVALLHDPTPPYTPRSEPLVNLRAYLAHLVATGALEAAARDEVVADLASRWFGERSTGLVAHLLAPHTGNDEALLRRRIRTDLPGFRLKGLDLKQFFELSHGAA